MERFYFTFGSSEDYPYDRESYVVVEAENYLSAQRIFQAVHPNPKDKDTVNCADTYTEKAWKEYASKNYKGQEPAEVISVFVGYKHSDRPNYDRCSELMTNAIHAMFDTDAESAKEWCEEQDMTESELRYTGADARIDELESEASA